MIPLNPDLYNALKLRFGSVKVSNEGQPYLGRQVQDPLRPGKFKEIRIDPGEQYRVCCPACEDRYHRLYVSHMWNTLDQYGQKKFRGLVNCFNEHCDLSFLENELRVYVSLRKQLVIKSNNKPQSFSEVKLPGLCVPLSSLPKNHKALVYIEKRKFDPLQLEKDWSVCYCESAPRDNEGRIPGTSIYAGLVQDRLVIPIFWQGQMVGWQARELHDEGNIKYYTMPGLNKQYLLFNGDRAKQYRFGVIVEGVFDAFRVGARAVALLGKTMSLHQQTLVHTFWQFGALAIMLDPDAVEDMEHLSQIMKPSSFRWGTFSVLLPYDCDPADMAYDELWSIIANAARARGVPLASV